MTGRTEHGTEGSINSAGLAALLDKLVAVELDLSPICRGSEEGPLVAAVTPRIHRSYEANIFL
jgi:hypothetical protein